MAEIKNNADPVIPVSKKVKSGMSLNVCDQQWIKRLLDTQAGAIGEAFDVNITQLTKALAEVQEDQNKRMFTVLEEQNKLIKEIRNDVIGIKNDINSIKIRLDNLSGKQNEHEVDITLLKKYTSFWSTALRVALAVALAVSISLFIIRMS